MTNVSLRPRPLLLSRRQQRTVVLIPPLSLVNCGRDEMRPLAKELVDGLGYRVLIFEWPGWTAEGAVNWALFRCKLDCLCEEYVEFWKEVFYAVFK